VPSSETTIVVTRRWPAPVEEELLRRYPGVRLNSADQPLSSAELGAALTTADAVLPTVSDRIGPELFDGALRTRFIGNFGVGFNHIDVDAARRRGVVVTNTPDVLTDATADLAMMLILMVARRAGEGERELRAGEWTGWRPTHLLGAEVAGRRLGVVGMGRIGRALARRAHFGFGMDVVFCQRGGPVEPPVPGARRLAGVDDVLAAADFVSLHIPGGGGNSGLIDARRLALMKPTAFLVNTARGDVVDQCALAAALRTGALAGAGIDVYQDEPSVPTALRELENVVLLPHLGSATLSTRIAMGMAVLDNLAAFLGGREPPARVV
jgi:lactate dehydrogenase-like 2-hydroxyacid dehydrogenase